MKPAELFPGAVALASCSMWEGQKVGVITSAHNAVAFVKTDYRPGSVTLSYEALSPLPISPAVLRGLGFGRTNNQYFKGGVFVWADFYQQFYLGSEDNMNITNTHQLQALALHLYGVELTWNQEEYEKAMKEDSK